MKENKRLFNSSILFSFLMLTACMGMKASGSLNASIDTPSGDQIVAEDSSVSFSGSATGGCPPYTYTWSFGSANPSSSTSATASATFGSVCSGIKTTVTFTVTDASGATDTDNVDITVPDIESTTVAHAPDGTDDRRDTIGVAESVDLQIRPQSLSGSVQWNCTGSGTMKTSGSGLFNTLLAGSIAEKNIVTATISGVTLTNEFNVIAPNSIVGYRKANPIHTTGYAAMEIYTQLLPKSVSFVHVYTVESDCPATNVKGDYFSHSSAPPHVANPNPDNTEANNVSTHSDDCIAEFSGPWYSGGSIDWDIPQNWVVLNQYGMFTSRTKITNIKQSMATDGSGNVTLSKFGYSVP